MLTKVVVSAILAGLMVGTSGEAPAAVPEGLVTGVNSVAVADEAAVTAASLNARCKCGPNDSCWPSTLEWGVFDLLLGKRLIKTSPIAESCYPGPKKDLADCDYVNKMWTDQNFQTAHPIGRVYPFNITCPPVNYGAGESPASCSLGINPRYVVNATSRYHISATLAYARLRNLRLVIASTGHDLLGRSDGYGSLEIWLRYYRNSINFQKTYTSANQCKKSGWTGSAVHIDGAWQWKDVYKVCQANDVICVGGGSLGPGAIGGWPSGGGHGPATRNYGLGSDNVLEIEVMLADGRIVIANHCQNTDLFKAHRGGGPGYGIILSSTVKAHPNVKAVTAHRLAVAPLVATPENAALLDAVTVLLRSMPELNDAGFAGYGFWFRNFPGPFIGNATSGYTHGIWTIGKKECKARNAFGPVMAQLQAFSDKLFIHETYTEYPDYWSFYNAESGLYDPAGDSSILTSRLIDKESLADKQKVRDAVEVLSGTSQEVVSNVILLVSGGQVFKDAADTTSGLHPAWRKSHFALITGQGAPRTASNELRKAVMDEITFVKGKAAKKLAPNTGGYMNEGDRNDPDYIQAFYGSNYASHLATKKKYDPTNVFFCPTCVGSEAFIERPDAPLCRR